MAWPTHYLKANKETRIPQNLLFVDTEAHGSQEAYEKTLPQRMTFRLGHAIHVVMQEDEVDTVRHLPFTSELAFWNFHRDCERPGKPLWTFAHNLHFDLTLLNFWHQLEALWFKVDTQWQEDQKPAEQRRKSYKGMLCLEDSPCFARVLGKRSTCWFVDTLNYFPVALKTIGKDYGVEKTAWPGFEANDEELAAYCRNDCEVLMAALVNLLMLWVREDCGNWKATAASLALANFQHWHADKREDVKGYRNRFNIRIDKDHPAIGLEREAYRGGRIEAFYFGKRPIESTHKQLSIGESLPPDERPYYLLDVRSLYPSVMASNPFPCARKMHLEELPVYEAHTLLNHYGITARCLISSPVDTYPVHFKGRQIHASGRFFTELCGHELKRALDAGHVLSIGECCIYEMDWLFAEWVHHWWDIRIAAEVSGDIPKEALAKLLMTSLSGKWAQKPERWQDLPGEYATVRWGEWKKVNPDDGTFRQMRSVGGWVQERVIGEDGSHVFPAISAFITSAARERMRDLMAVARPENVYWIGTDAILCNRFAMENLNRNGAIAPATLGGFAVVEVADTVEVIGTNAYQIGERYRAAGLWGKAVGNDDAGYKASLWQRIAATLATRPDGSITIAIANLQERNFLPKGELLADGWVKPLHFPEPPVHWSAAEFAGKERRRKVLDVD